ncbi:hypothetical protein PMKS-002643 [Pichia membranifaciens]|uniref:Uncharacterized protein n=1 Tax=Pichia membranifaciens TaxID=4926 RepID=A0A1Q2YIG9_9ASCO|nr:hypothetical protein PMKS-002643 [Pichia membranifaciens]
MRRRSGGAALSLPELGQDLWVTPADLLELEGVALLEDSRVLVQREEEDGRAGDNSGDQDGGDVQRDEEGVAEEREKGVVGEAEETSEDGQVEVGDDGAEDGGEEAVKAHRGGDNKVVQERLDPPLSEKQVRGASGADHRDAVEGDKRVRVEVEVADTHAEDVHAQVAHKAKQAGAVDHEEDGDGLEQHDKQRAKADGAKAVREGPLERAGGLAPRHAVEGALHVVPRAVDAADGDVHDVLEHVDDVQPGEVKEEDRQHQLGAHDGGRVAVVVEPHRAVAVEAKGDVRAADGERQNAYEEGAAEEANQCGHGRAWVPLHHGDDDVQDCRRE